MPPFRSGKKAGLVVGEGIGSCIPGFEHRRSRSREASPGPTADDAAASA